jgi:multiple sugar transport system substrate-binding protein
MPTTTEADAASCGVIERNTERSDFQLTNRLKRSRSAGPFQSTSLQTQINQLKLSGGTPDRKAVLLDPEVAKARHRPTTMPNALTFDAVYDWGIKDPHFVLGPKFPKANAFYQIISSEVQKCLSNTQSPEETCQTIKKQTDQLNGV